MKIIEAQHIPLHGAVSVERRADGIKPWRIPYEERALFVPEAINGKAEVPAGVRISFVSDTRSVVVDIIAAAVPMLFDCVVDGQLFGTVEAMAGEKQVVFEGLSNGRKQIDIYLTQLHPITLTGLKIDPGTLFEAIKEDRPRWIAYGSSITQCEDAASPSQTWPALVADRMGWDLTCLGFSANCQMETMVARMIRDLPADYISLCIGINIMGGGSYNLRTFRAAVIGFVKTIRERHSHIPIILQSPIFSRDRETQPNKVDMTLPIMRSEIYEAYLILRDHGDQALYYMDGLDIMGEQDDRYMPDHLHPNAEGYMLMADRMEAALRKTLVTS